MRWRPVMIVLTATLMLALGHGAAAAEEAQTAEVLIYGGTPGGIAAALAAAEHGRTVILVEPTRHIGGLVTSGLSHADFRTFEGLTGAYLRLTHRVQAYYISKYGRDSPQAKGNFRGTHAEPHVNLAVFNAWCAEHPKLRVVREHRLASVQVLKRDDLTHIESATFIGPDDAKLTVIAKVFIDGTYEGDLMALAGVKYHVGREGRDVYGESLAPEKGDDQLQGYNFRLCLTQVPDNRAPVPKPRGYNREHFVAVLPMIEKGQIKSVFCDNTGGFYKAQQPSLPNGKHDINDVSRGLVRLSMPPFNKEWPDGNAAIRQRIFDAHVRHNIGLLYFLQHDEAVPEAFAKEARQWGLCKDEFTDNGHLPPQLYVREARRMVGMHVFTERDTDHAENDARSVLHTDAIAMGDYGPNCHGTEHEGPKIGGRHVGEFYKQVSPYQIPYGTLVPRECDNLLVPVAASSSHVGFCALRLEPIWMSLGEAAGTAAHVAITSETTVQKVSVPRVQRLLHGSGAATIYISDVSPDSKDFAAVQWWATAGGLHGLAPKPAKSGQRGQHLRGQYYHAFPNHGAQLDQKLDEATQARWLELARTLGLETASLEEAQTRGEFVRRAFELNVKK